MSASFLIEICGGGVVFLDHVVYLGSGRVLGMTGAQVVTVDGRTHEATRTVDELLAMLGYGPLVDGRFTELDRPAPRTQRRGLR